MTLFYGRLGDKFFLSVNVDEVKKRAGAKERFRVAEIDLLLSGYVTGNDTLYASVNQIQVGEAYTDPLRRWTPQRDRVYSG